MKPVFTITCFAAAQFMLLQVNAQKQQYNFEEHSVVKLAKAENAEVEIDLLAGELNLTGMKIPQLLVGEYLFNDRDLGQPVRTYTEDNQTGYLHLHNKEVDELELDIDNEKSPVWNLQLKNNIPVDLNIEMGAGEGNIMLNGAPVRRFRYVLKAGEANIDLRNTSVPKLDFKALAGEATIDISGKWKNDLQADIKGGIGNLNLILPGSCNIEIEVSGILGEVHAEGLIKEGNYYTRKAGKDSPTLYIDVAGGIGSINLRVQE
jgi:hypothetical protein